MKKIVLIFAVVLTALFLFMNCNHSDNESVKGGIEFQHLSFENAISKAKAEKKVLFIDAYADWCGPCKQLTKKTFVDKKVATAFNAKFVNVKMNVDDAEGKVFAEKFAISSIPTLFFFDAEGNLLKEIKGFHTPEELLKEAAPFLK